MRASALPVLLVIALIGFAVSHPAASNWISEAVQAEFVGTDWCADTTQTAQPAQLDFTPSDDQAGLAQAGLCRTRDWRRVRS